MAVREDSFEDKCDAYRAYVDGEIDRATAKRRIGDDWDEVVVHVRSESLRDRRAPLTDEEVATLFC